MAQFTLKQQIGEAQSEVEHLQHQYLRRCGWEYTSNTPGSYWLWRRDFAKEDVERLKAWEKRPAGPLGKSSKPQPWGVITAGTDLAVAITERSLDDEIDQDGDPDTPTITEADLVEA